MRGPVRYLHPTNWNDLAQNYAATRLWLEGKNFAQPAEFVLLWKNEVGETLDANTVRTHLSPPWGTVVLMAPIGALPWPLAKLAWLAVLLGGFGATVWGLIKTAGFELREPRTMAFIAGCLALAPFHTGIASANQTILVVGLCALGIWAASGRRDIVAGLLFGAACSLKPQHGSFIVLYYLVRRRWKLFFTALGFTITLALIAIGWMQIHGVTWAPDYFHNVKILAAQNRIDDFTSANPIRFLLVNLQVPIYSFTRSAGTSNIVALSAGGLLTAIWIFLVTRVRSTSSELLALATIAVIALLPVYHRFYDAALLAIPFCWCLTDFGVQMKNVSRPALLLMTPFLLPGPAILQQLAATGRIPAAWSRHWVWERFVMPHENWLLLLLSVTLLYGLAKGARYGQEDCR